MSWLLTGLLALAAPPAVSDLWPCTPGLSIRYRVSKGGEDTGLRITETVQGRKAPNLCVLNRVVARPGGARTEERFVLELHPDRILYAGFADALTAFRPPLVRAPIARGARWTFNRVGYSIEEVGTTFDTPAGTFEGCVRVREHTLKGDEHFGYTVYAPGVGPVVKVTKGTRMTAEAVSRPKARAEDPARAVRSVGEGAPRGARRAPSRVKAP